MAKRYKILFYFSINLVLLLVLSSCNYDKTVVTLGSEFDNTWSFNSGSGYDYDDNLIEIVNGKAQLKPLDLEHSGVDFNNGTHVGASFLHNQNIGIRSILTEDFDLSQTQSLQSTELLAYYRMENNWNDSSGNNHHGSVFSGNPSFLISGEKINQYKAKFTGTPHEYIEIETAPEFARTSFTTAAWVNMNGTLNGSYVYGAIFSRGHNTGEGSEQNYMTFIRNTGEFGVRVGHGLGNGSTDCESGSVVSSLGWHHLAATVSSELGNTKVRVFIDGNLINECETLGKTPFSSAIGNPTIGAWDTGGNSYGAFPGEIDDLAFWGNTLSPSDILEIYQLQKISFSRTNELSKEWTPQWDNIVGYWKMDGNWQDSSGNGNHGTAQNGLNFSSDMQVGTSAGLFDGTDDYVDLGSIDNSNSLILNGQSFSISTWAKIDTIPLGSTRIFDKSTSSFGADGYSLAISNTREIRAFTMGQSYPSGQLVDLNKWVHIAYIQTPTYREIYYNGERASREDGAYPLPNGTTATARIGNWQTSNQRAFNGKIDEISIWNTNLNSDDILIIYNRQKQKYASHYDSQVMDLGSTTETWPDLSWSTNLPFGKELVGDFDNDGNPDSESSSDYYGLSGSLSSGLVGYWNFNESLYDSGPGASDFADASISNGHGNEVGGAIIGQNGYFNKAVFLDGIDDYIDFSDNATVPSGLNSTVSFWFKTNRMSVTQRLGQYGVKTGCSPSSMIYQLNLDGAIQLFVGCGGNVASNPGLVKAGQWHHFLSFTNSSGETSVYINGNEAIPPTDIRSGQTLGNGFFVLGTVFAGGVPALFTQGHYDEVGIWDRVLSIDEIQQLYRRGANRVKLQVKSCVDSSCNCKSYGAGGTELDCDGDTIVNNLDNDDIHKAEFIGPGGDGTTYYSELYNRNTTDVTFNCALNTSDSNPGVCVEDEITLTGSPKPTGPEFLNIDYTQFVNPSPNRYAQYRVYMEADENTACGGEPCLPELSSVSLNPSGDIKYSSEYVEVKPSSPINFTRLVRITIDADSCAMFRLARGSTQYYYDSGAWTPVTTDADRSPASDLENHAVQFQTQFGPGPLEVVGYLKSDSSGNSQCRIDEIDVGYK